MGIELELLHELRDRVIRTESRIVQLGDHVGANLRAKQKIHPKVDGFGQWFVDVDSHDVSVSRILATLKERGITQRNVNVWVGGTHSFTLHQTE